jgi:hypothetical protein
VRHRNGFSLIAWWIASAGLYELLWLGETRLEMNRLGARIPSMWLLVVPMSALYWAWCWAEGVRHVTAGRTSVLAAFLLWLLGPFGMALLQGRFNALTSSRLPDPPRRSTRAVQDRRL